MAKKEKEIKTNAMRLLEQKKISYMVHTYDGEEFHDGVSVADMLGQPHEIVYKTLVTVAKSKAVSYTHLDVYKRQVWRISIMEPLMS